MTLHKGERVFWGTPEIMYLEGIITALDEEMRLVLVHIERATPHSAHLINTDVTFAANGVTPLKSPSPPGTTDQPAAQRLPPPVLDENEKIRRAAASAVHQQHGYNLPPEREEQLISQVAEAIASDPEMRSHVLSSMDEILKREW